MRAGQRRGVWKKVLQARRDRVSREDKLDWDKAIIDRASIRAVLGGGTDGHTRQDKV
jgi:hypothetical protein